MPHPKVKISDDSGNTVAVDTSGGSNALKVALVDSAAIDIGDVSLLLGGTAADHGAGDVGDPNNTLRVTLASDDVAVAGLDVIKSAVGTHNGVAGAQGIMLMGESRIVDGSAFPPVSQEGDSTTLQCSLYGVQYTHLVTESGSDSAIVIDDITQAPTPGMVNVGGEYRSGDTTYSDGDATILQTNVNGALKTTHNITGGGQGIKVTTGAGNHIVLGGDVACKKIDIQAQTDNTGLIAVGFNNVDVTEADGDGIILYAGDTYSLEMNNLNLIYIDSTVTGDGVRYTYFT